MRVRGGIAGVSSDFTQNVITWKFSNTNGSNTVTVVNNNPPNSNVVDFFDSGVYEHKYIDNTIPDSCEHTSEIGGINFGCQKIDGTTMTLVQEEADGYILTFRKN